MCVQYTYTCTCARVYVLFKCIYTLLLCQTIRECTFFFFFLSTHGTFTEADPYEATECLNKFKGLVSYR